MEACAEFGWHCNFWSENWLIWNCVAWNLLFSEAQLEQTQSPVIIPRLPVQLQMFRDSNHHRLYWWHWPYYLYPNHQWLLQNLLLLPCTHFDSHKRDTCYLCLLLSCGNEAMSAWEGPDMYLFRCDDMTLRLKTVSMQHMCIQATQGIERHERIELNLVLPWHN